MKNKILFIQPCFSPYRAELFNLLNSNEKYDITVFYLEGFDTRRKWNNEFENIKFNFKIFKSINLFFGSKKLKYSNLSFDENHFDKIIIGTDFPFLINLLKFSFSLNKYWSWVAIYDDYRLVNIRFIDKIMYNIMKLIVSRSQTKALSYSSYVTKICKNKTVFFSSQFYPLEKEYGEKVTPSLDSFKGNFLIISYIDKRKNIEKVINVFNKFPKYKLSIYGSGDEFYIDKLKRISRENIFFGGYADSTLKKKLFKRNDFFIMSTNKDTWGYTVNESLFNFCPVIGSIRSMAVCDLIVDGINGFKYQTEAELESIINSIDKVEIKELRANARNSITIFQSDVIKKIHKFLD